MNLSSISFGHKYVLDAQTRTKVNNQVAQAHQMLSAPKSAFLMAEYDALNKKLSTIENEDHFAQEAENEYEQNLAFKKQQIKKLKSEVVEMENNKESSIANILGSKLLGELQYLLIDIGTQNLYNSPGFEPNR